MKAVQIADARSSIIETGLKLLELKLITGSWGNISVKIDKDSFVITPSGRSYESLAEEDIIMVNSKGMKFRITSYNVCYTKLLRRIVLEVIGIFKNQGKAFPRHGLFPQIFGNWRGTAADDQQQETAHQEVA